MAKKRKKDNCEKMVAVVRVARRLKKKLTSANSSLFLDHNCSNSFNGRSPSLEKGEER